MIDGGTKVSDEQIVELMQKGFGVVQIARTLGMSKGAISKRVSKIKSSVAREKAAEKAKLEKAKKARERFTREQEQIQKARAEMEKITAEVVTARSTGDTLDVRAVFERLMSSLNNSLDFLEESEIVATDLERPGILKQKMSVISETRQLVGTIASLYQTILFQREYEKFCENVYGALNELSEDDRERVVKELQRRAITFGAD